MKLGSKSKDVDSFVDKLRSEGTGEDSKQLPSIQCMSHKTSDVLRNVFNTASRHCTSWHMTCPLAVVQSTFLKLSQIVS